MESAEKEKLAVYSFELDKITKALAIKRTEMATLARQTVENLESSIPQLKEDVAILNKEIERLNKCIEDKITNGYINAINSRNNSFEFIFNLIETELKKEAEILNNNNNNKRLLRVLNNKKLL